MKLVIVALAAVLASWTISSDCEPTPGQFDHTREIVYSAYTKSGTVRTIIQLPDSKIKIFDGMVPVATASLQNDILLRRLDATDKGLLWAWNPDENRPRLLFDAAKWPKIHEIPVAFSPASNENYMAVSDGYHKIWMVSLKSHHFASVLDIHQIRKNLGLRLVDYPTDGSFISLSPSGHFLAINLPADWAMNPVTPTRHLAETYIMNLDSMKCRYLGQGSPVAWIGNEKVICKTPGSDKLDSEAVVYSIDSPLTCRMSGVYSIGIDGNEPVLARSETDPNSKIISNSADLWDGNLTMKRRSFELDNTPLQTGYLGIVPGTNKILSPNSN